FTASAMATLLRPQLIRMSGQGGAKRSLPDPSERKGQGHQLDGSASHGRRGLTRLMTGSSPSASLSPRHWLSMPAAPSVTIQQLGFVMEPRKTAPHYGNPALKAARGPVGKCN